MNQIPALLSMALEYERLGFSVIPLLPRDKRPNGPLLPLNAERKPTWTPFQIECADSDRILVWWDKSETANVGIVCGQVSGVVVLDVDGPEGSDQLTGRDMPRTPYVATGKGWHYYFAHPGFEVSNFARKLPGLDFRGDGGYVVAPPSIHPSGSTYAWALTPNQQPFAALPKWLLDVLTEKRQQPPQQPIERPRPTGKHTAYAQKAFDNQLATLRSAIEGERNATLNNVALSLGHLVGANELSESEVFNALLSTALGIGLSETESRKTINSGMTKGKAEPSIIEDNSPIVVKQAAQNVVSMEAADNDLISISEVASTAKDRAIAWATDPRDIRGYRTGIEELDSALSGILENDIVIILGRTGGGKSTFCTQVLCEIATQTRLLAFTTEMTPEWYLHRIASYKIGVNSKDIFTGKLGQDNRLLNAYDSAGQWPIDFYKHDNPTPDLIIRKAEQARERGAKGIILDSLNNVYTPGRSVYDGTKDTMAALRHIARGLGMFVIATCQANRGPSDRANKEPLLSDAQGGGVIEQDATRFLTIYRPGYDIETRQVKADIADPIDPRVAYLTVVKDRMFSAQGKRIETLWEAGRGYQKLTKRNIDLEPYNSNIPVYRGGE